MANHASAQKRARQNEKRRIRNRHVKSTVRGYVKKVRDAIALKDHKTASKALKTAVSQIDRAVAKGVFLRATGSRYISRLSSQIAALTK